MGIGWTEVLVVVLVVMLLFGASRLPAALGGLGKGIREFRKAVRGEDEPASGDVAADLRAGLGKRVRFMPDGTVEVGLQDGATLVEVDSSWATVQEVDSTTLRYPVARVKRVVFKA